MSMRVIVSGAGGKMGLEALRAVHEADGMQLAGGADPKRAGEDIGELAGVGPMGIEVAATLEKALRESGATHVVDFTTPDAVYDNVMASLNAGAHVVFGTTGLSDDQLSAIDRRAKELDLGVVHAPNFAVGAVLMMRFAEEAARYMEGVEIIELHHDQKRDAPSGTAMKTARLIAEARRSVPVALDEIELAPGARGGEVNGLRVHSVRLPGLVAHQEVIFGTTGETLTIRHDSYDRRSFMPGVVLALRRVGEIRGLVYGLESLLFDE